MKSVFIPSPAATATTPVSAGVETALACLDLLAHVADVEPLHVAGLLEHGDGHLGLVGVDVHLQGGLVTDHQHRVADLLQALDEGTRLEPLPGDDEVRAVAKAAVEVVRARLPWWLAMRDLRGRVGLAAKPGDDPRQDHHQPVRARVHHAGLRQHVELLGGSLDGLLARPGSHREHLGQELVLLGVPRLGGEALAVHVRQVL